MNKEEFTATFSDLLEIDSTQMNFDVSLKSIPAWDSAALVGIMAFALEHDAKLGIDALSACNTVADVYSLVFPNA